MYIQSISSNRNINTYGNKTKLLKNNSINNIQKSFLPQNENQNLVKKLQNLSQKIVNTVLKILDTF